MSRLHFIDTARPILHMQFMLQLTPDLVTEVCVYNRIHPTYLHSGVWSGQSPLSYMFSYVVY